jgi:hypothetical protein
LCNGPFANCTARGGGACEESSRMLRDASIPQELVAACGLRPQSRLTITRRNPHSDGLCLRGDGRPGHR